jgi:ATP-dependent Clp protease protease subunit
LADVLVANNSEFFDKVFEDNLKERRIIINSEVDESLVEMAMIWILKWNKEDEGKPIDMRKPIEILCNTPGGSVQDGFVLCNIIENSETPIHITTLGMAASMGAYIAMCGTKGYRKCYEFSTFLIHSGSLVVGGNSNDVESTVKYYSEMKADIEKFAYKHTKITKEMYKEHQKDEWYITARLAKELGIVDEIIGIK